ncbi:NUDIX domain-containing protein [Limnohabitans sp. Rim8]|jgi:8-oxo-dGTP pyrophosphatase MutT (NUDIX family)|uniref:NUDIX hydrolase n=1 Tax=Limnohabitans sp. Rim8 TaxID=1100718 RepID=UPI0025DD9D73|nr:NUDIX domain-containing protein [Limnohabitans sp. Rim8]
MNPGLCPEQAFWSRLNGPQQAWLASQLQAQHMPPAGGLRWLCDGINIGWVSADRAQDMVALLPGCTLVQGRLRWQTAADQALQRSQALQAFLVQQAAHGRLTGWRGEFFAWWPDTPAWPPALDVPPFLCVERAGFRHLGMMSHAVHIHGFLPQGDLWCGRRSGHKAIDPGLLDNLAAGGLTAGESPLSTAVRELAEEAGLHLSEPSRLRGSGVIRTQRPEPQGWHDEQLLVYTLHLSERETPINADGEVQEFRRLSPDEVVSCMQSGQFTVDACASLAQSLAWLMAGSDAITTRGNVR